MRSHTPINLRASEESYKTLNRLALEFPMSKHSIANRALEIGLSVLTEQSHRWMADGGDGRTDSYVLRNDCGMTKYTYHVHDNGGRPWRVLADHREVTIIDNFGDRGVVHRVPGYEGFWWGYDTSGSFAHGNTILVDKGLCTYLYIQRRGLKFTTPEPITDFVSPLGNSDVPYPVAFSKNYVYFLAGYGGVDMVDREDLKTRGTMRNARTLYIEFYGHEGFSAPKRIPIQTALVFDQETR